eukprot:gene61061-83525_t
MGSSCSLSTKSSLLTHPDSQTQSALPNSFQVLYPMVSLLVSGHDSIVRQAARCSLRRIAIYLQYRDMVDMIRYSTTKLLVFTLPTVRPINVLGAMWTT